MNVTVHSSVGQTVLNTNHFAQSNINTITSLTVHRARLTMPEMVKLLRKTVSYNHQINDCMAFDGQRHYEKISYDACMKMIKNESADPFHAS